MPQMIAHPPSFEYAAPVDLKNENVQKKYSQNLATLSGESTLFYPCINKLIWWDCNGEMNRGKDRGIAWRESDHG